MTWSTIASILTAQVVKVQAFAVLHRLVIAMVVELVGAIMLIWAVAYRPRTCIVVTVVAYFLSRYYRTSKGA